MKTLCLIFWILLGMFMGGASADVTLPSLFGDHMVLQRGGTIPVWGKAAPNETISVALGPVKATTAADQDGKWMVRLQGLNPAITATELVVAGSSNQITIHDVLIGDVWLCAGQSNMAFPLQQEVTSKTEVPVANHPEVRMFVPKYHTSLTAQEDCEGSWVVCTPDTAKTFSAVAYFFGKEIAATQKAPVGLIGLYGGDAPAQAWVSLEALKANPELKKIYVDPVLQGSPSLETIQQAHDKWAAAGGKTYLDAMGKWNAAVDAAKKANKPPPPKPPVPAGFAWEPLSPGDPRLPAVLNNALITPVVPYAIKGVIWYQGEANTGLANSYAKLLAALITDWRKSWGEGDFPFLYVQLPGFQPPTTQPEQANAWALLREAQATALGMVPNTGMAVTLDLGNGSNTHPPDKVDVGHRLALIARQIAYGEKISYSGPTYYSSKLDGNVIHVTFKKAAQGINADTSPLLPPSAQASEIKGFTIAGVDGKFVQAKAEVEGANSVCVSSDQVPSPMTVRYGWGAGTETNLYNSDKLPAAPFRSDAPQGPVPDAALVAQADDFFMINGIRARQAHQDEFSPIYNAVRKKNDRNIWEDTKVFLPYLEVNVSAKSAVKLNSVIARVYFYDQDKKMITNFQKPSVADRGNHQISSWPDAISKEKPGILYFAIPDQVQQLSNWSAVVVFGDTNGVTAQLYPGSSQLADYDYPGKKPAEVPSGVEIVHKAVTDPIITHLEPTGNPDQPQITLFMRLPIGMTNPTEAKGVLCMSLLANHLEDVKLQLQGLAAADQLGDVLKFADAKHLIIICWGSHGLWDPNKNWDEQSVDKTWETDKTFDQVARAWSNGMQYFVKEYGLPPNNYLLWGISGSAQYACRLALRYPDYFLAVHAHIPSSFDKPTLQANKILWCLTTGELESGHQRSLKFYAQCRELGYPMIYKAVVGLRHAWSPITSNLGLKFFDYALTVRDQRTAYDANVNLHLQTTPMENGQLQPWLESFRKPAYVGDAVNQAMVPCDQADSVPKGFRVPLPTKEIADAWNH